MNAQWQNSRGLSERIVVTGTLVLETPTHLGNGDADSPLDMPLILDPLEGRALLTGTSIAGALQNYLREYSEHSSQLANKLFGYAPGDESGQDNESAQSPLIVDDALGVIPDVELRDGVAIDPKTRTAEDKKKFDIELLVAGTEFPLSFELLVMREKETDLREAFVLALQGLEKGEIYLGKRKRRGFGRCRVSQWTACRYDFTTPQGLIPWLEQDRAVQTAGADIAGLLNVTIAEEQQRAECILDGTFIIDGSLLIRSGFGEPNAPDFVHLQSKRDGQAVPVLSGTSLAGAFRARAWRIATTLGKDGKSVTDRLFGHRRVKNEDKTPPTASRVWIDEAEVKNPLERVQSRVKIDRFTGGSYLGALFSEQPVFGRNDTRVRLQMKIDRPTDADVGLLLLLLKDLWTGDLPVGGASSVGRGRLRGDEATLTYNNMSWTFAQGDRDTIHVEGERANLERFVQTFVEGKDDAAGN